MKCVLVNTNLDNFLLFTDCRPKKSSVEWTFEQAIYLNTQQTAHCQTDLSQSAFSRLDNNNAGFLIQEEFGNFNRFPFVRLIKRRKTSTNNPKREKSKRFVFAPTPRLYRFHSDSSSVRSVSVLTK